MMDSRLSFSLRWVGARRRALSRILFVFCALAILGPGIADAEQGFVSLLKSNSLDGWTYVGPNPNAYKVVDGVLVAVEGSKGNLFTKRQYTNFVLRLEFRLTPGANNGIGIRAPLEGDAAYVGMELQVLDDDAPKYANLRAVQYHGSIYDVVAAKRGALKPAGEWNKQEITVHNRRVRVVLNDKVIVDADLAQVSDPAVLRKHPGLLREAGHIGFLSHGDLVEFRNVRIKELP